MTVCAKALSNLPPLSKGGGLTARHKLLIYCVCLQYIRLFILQAFLPSRRRDCHATLACINPSKTALSFEKHYILARPRKRVRFCCSVKPSQLWWGLNLTELLSHSLFVGRASVCAWLALRPCKALGHTRLRHPCLACPSRCTEYCHPHNHCK